MESELLKRDAILAIFLGKAAAIAAKSEPLRLDGVSLEHC